MSFNILNVFLQNEKIFRCHGNKDMEHRNCELKTSLN